MVDIKPFKGVQYNKEIAKELAKVVTQPYDKISPDLQSVYYERSPFNVIRIEKNKAEVENNPYLTANQYFQKWLKDGVFKQSTEDVLYYLTQTFDFFGEKVTRKALIGMGGVCEYSENVVYPHEQTLKGPKVDRLELIRATKSNLGQLFMLYEDKECFLDSYIESLKDNELYASFTDDDGVEQKVYIVKNKEALIKISEFFKDKKVFIADGHHRYETALAYSKENKAATHHLMSLVNAYDDGLRILPTHRVINFKLKYDFKNSLKKIENNFSVKKVAVPSDLKEIHNLIKELPKNSFLYIDAADKANFYEFKLKSYDFKNTPKSLSELDVYILHEAILANVYGVTKDDLANNTYITYKRDPIGSVKAVLDGKEAMCFLLNPTKVEEVINVALDKQTMPQKSTDFYPKLLTGYVLADVSK